MRAQGNPPNGVGRSDRRIALLLFALFACVFLLFQEGAITGSDGNSMYQVTRSIVRDRDLTVQPNAGVLGRDGASYSKYGLGQPLVSLVPYVLALPVAKVASHHREAIEQAAVSALLPILSALLVLAMFLLALRLGAGARAAGLVAGGSVAGTYLLPYTKEFLSEPLATLCIVLAIERALARRHGWSGAALALGILTRPQTLVFAPVLLGVAWRRDGARAMGRAAFPLAAGVAIMIGYNVARFGDATEFGYGSEPGFTTPFLAGARDLLFHPDKSVLLFAPIVVLLPVALARLWRADRDAFTLLVGNLSIAFVLSATWWSWAGGWAWGPRLLIPGVIPALAAIAPWIESHARPTRAAAALFLAGLAVSAPALIVSTRAQQLDQPPPQVGPGVARQYELLAPTTEFTLANVEDRDIDDHRRFLTLWQVNAISVLGNKALLLVAPLSIALVAGSIAAGVRLRRVLEAH